MRIFTLPAIEKYPYINSQKRMNTEGLCFTGRFKLRQGPLLLAGGITYLLGLM